MRDARRFTRGNARCRGQHPGVQPLRVQRGKSGQLLGTGSQQDSAGPVGQIGGGLCRTGQHHAACRRIAGRAQQAVVFHPRRRGRRTDIARGLGGIGVGGVHAERRALQNRRHLAGIQPPGAHRNAVRTALFLGPEVGCHADRDRRAQRRQCAGEGASFGCAAENHCPHTP